MQFKMNDVIYAIRGTTIIKGVIDEIIEHHTQKEEIVKYIVRPFGMNQFVTFDSKDIFLTLEEAKEVTINIYKNNYSKVMQSLEDLTDDMFDNLEQEKGDK